MFCFRSLVFQSTFCNIKPSSFKIQVFRHCLMGVGFLNLMVRSWSEEGSFQRTSFRRCIICVSRKDQVITLSQQKFIISETGCIMFWRTLMERLISCWFGAHAKGKERTRKTKEFSDTEKKTELLPSVKWLDPSVVATFLWKSLQKVSQTTWGRRSSAKFLVLQMNWRKGTEMRGL